MLAIDEALEHQRRRQVTTNRATSLVLKSWRTINPQELDAGWERVGGAMVSAVMDAQLVAAKQAAPFLATVYPDAPAAELIPAAFVGVTLDGRELAPAMFGAVTTVKSLTGTGYSAGRAFEVGASFLATVVGSAIQDMGRAADSTLAVGKHFTRYVRVVTPGACSRCAVLAGKSSYKLAFRRHSRCRCTAMPLANNADAPSGFFDTPDQYFESLSRAEQDRVFTRAGAEAIRNGADISKIVNARRGAYGIGYSGHYNTPVSGNRLQKLTIGVKADGSPLQVYATTESTTRRGDFGRANFTGTGRRTTTVRLMPEQIAVMAGDDPERWRKLLVRYGYLA